MGRIYWLIVMLLAVMPVYVQNPPSPTELEIISVENVAHIQELAAIKGAAPVQKLAWSPDGERLAVLRGDFVLQGEAKHNTVEIWNFSNDALPMLPDVVLTTNTVDEMDWLADSLSLVTHGEQDTDDKAYFLVVKWDAQTGEPLETLMDTTVIRPLFMEYEGEKYYRQAVPPTLAWNHAYTESVSLMGNVGLRFSNGHMYRADYPDTYGRIHSLSWTPDDQFIVVDYGGDDTYHIEVLEAGTLKSVLLADGEDYSVQEIAWSPDHVSFAVASSWSSPFNPHENVRFYRVGEMVGYGGAANIVSAPIPEFEPGGQPYYPPSLAWSADGSLIAIKFPVALEFYETETYTKLSTVPEPGINTVAWHPSGKFLVTGDMAGSIRLWGVEAPKVSLENHSSITP